MARTRSFLLPLLAATILSHCGAQALGAQIPLPPPEISKDATGHLRFNAVSEIAQLWAGTVIVQGTSMSDARGLRGSCRVVHWF